MALTVGTNSYLSRQDADDYFSTHILGGTWSSFSDSQKDAGLVTATGTIDDEFRFIGVAISGPTGLAWPRDGATYADPKTGAPVTVPEDEVPDRVTRATAELALHLLRFSSDMDPTSQVFDRIKVGSIEIEDTSSQVQNMPRIPSNVKALLLPLQPLSSSSNAWWRAN